MDTISTRKNELEDTIIKPKKRKKGDRNDTKILHLLMLPCVVLLIIYAYVPMIGIVMAFQDFDMTKGPAAFFTSEWVGLKNFTRIFNMPDFRRALFNTINIAWWKMFTMFFVPLFAALLLNEVKKSWFKRGVQTIIYLPHFLSWVILAGILKNVLSIDGIFNNFLSMFGVEPSYFLINPKIFPDILVWSNVWKEFGFSSIIFLAAITSIDPTLYEAAIMDGAGKLKQVRHVTIPGIKGVLVLCLVLSLGGILNAGFDQVFNLYSVPVQETGDILDTLVYRIGLGSGKYEIATAVGLFKSVVSLIFVSASYWFAYKWADYRIF
jgi:putative aldouronate transport system permease protein